FLPCVLRAGRLADDDRGAGLPPPRIWQPRCPRLRLLPLLRPVLVRRPVVRLPVPLAAISVALSLLRLRRGFRPFRREAEGSRSLRRRLLRGRRRRLRRGVSAAARRAGRARDRAVSRRPSNGAAEGLPDAGQHLQNQVHDGAPRGGRTAGGASSAFESAAGAGRRATAGAAAADAAAAHGTRTGRTAGAAATSSAGT